MAAHLLEWRRFYGTMGFDEGVTPPATFTKLAAKPSASGVARDADGVRAFLTNALRAPLRTGAVAPSSRVLAEAVAGCARLPSAGSVVELGGGTGAITGALLEKGLSQARLTVVEYNPHFCRMLAARYPSVRVMQGDATRFKELLRRARVRDCAAVISSLPLSFMSRRGVYRMLAEIFESLEGRGVFLQFSYNVIFPVSAVVLRRLGLTVRRVKVIWRNLPPAHVWLVRPERRVL